MKYNLRNDLKLDTIRSLDHMEGGYLPAWRCLGSIALTRGIVKHSLSGANTKPGLAPSQASVEFLTVVRVGEPVVIPKTQNPKKNI